MSVYDLIKLGTKNFLEAVTANKRTGINQEKLIGDRQLVHDQKVGQRQDDISSGRVAHH